MDTSLFKKIIHAGISEDHADAFNDKLKISNSISLIIAFGAAAPFIIISYFLYPDIVWIPYVGMFIAISGVLFNYLGLHNLSRYLVSVIPLTLATLYQANVLDANEELISGVYTIQLAFALFPFLMIRLEEKQLLLASMLSIIGLFMLQNTFNAFFELNLDSSLFRDSWLNTLALCLGLFISFAAVLTLVFINNRSTKNNLKLLTQINEERNKGKEAEAALKENIERIELSQEDERRRNWTAEGLSALSDIIRRNQDSDKFYNELINYVVKYLDANQGVLYTVEGTADEKQADDIEIVPQAAYAFSRVKRLKQRFKKGEGLVGQAYLEKDVIYLTEVPAQYINITSGLGDANPRCIVIMPLIQNEAVEGIVEIASFRVLDEYEVAFLKEAASTIASSIFNFRINSQTKLLLEESQQQTEEMRAQEEEMRQNMEELQATQEQIERNRQEQAEEIKRLEDLHQKNTEKYRMLSLVADHTDNSVIITGPDGLIEYVNSGFTKLTDFKLEEVKGKKPGAFLQGVDTDQGTVKRIREKLDANQPFYEEILNYDKSGKEYWISMAINPVFDAGRLTNYVSVQANITDTKQVALDQTSQVEAIDRNLATIEFDLYGNIKFANQNFLQSMGYSLEEVQGQHHRIFMKPEEVNEAYEGMWESLRLGETLEGEFQRLDKTGNIVWLKANYTPILDITGKPYKIIKYAQDITKTKEIALDFDSQIEAISRNNAIIEFDLNGNIKEANQNFLNSMGYTLAEIEGKHHSMFVFDEDLGNNYEQLWKDLRNGKPQTADFRRKSKTGNIVWLKSTYTPILNLAGEPYKIVKYAIDITESKEQAINYQSQLEAIWRNYAVIEFDLEGKVTEANENFLQTMEYTKSEILGKHHKLFVPEEDMGNAYHQMWEDLLKGISQSSDFRRKTKSDKIVWLKSIYTPILDLSGKPYKVVKYAQDITDAKELAMDFNRQMDALNRSNVIVEFDSDGIIRNTNDKFSELLKYDSKEIIGEHHAILVPTKQQDAAYHKMWDRIKQGEIVTGNFERLSKGGKVVKINSTYTPILNASGKVSKVIKYARAIA